MPLIDIKPLTVNQCWQGKRYKTPKYRAYCKELSLLLPETYDVPDGKLEIQFAFYLSSKCADWDNPIKPAQDIICAKYGINDNRIYKATVEKIDCEKDEEKLYFYIRPYYQGD